MKSKSRLATREFKKNQFFRFTSRKLFNEEILGDMRKHLKKKKRKKR